jgi:hypothetical protein
MPNRFNPFSKGNLYRIASQWMGTGYYNGYSSNGGAHQSNGEPTTKHYLRDWNNAKRFNPGINPVRQKFQGYVNFHFNPEVGVADLHTSATRNTLSSMCKTAEVPSAEIQTDVKNQYNRKRITVTHAEMKPITVTAYDTVDSAWVVILMKAYAHLFINPIGKFDMSADGPTPKIIKGDVVPDAVAGGGSEAVKSGNFDSNTMGYNLQSALKKNFITSMDIVKYHGQKAIRYTIFNPIITNFEIDGIDHADSQPAMITMNISYENFSINPEVNQWITEEELERFTGFNTGAWEKLRNGNTNVDVPGGTQSQRSVLNNPGMAVKNLDFLVGGTKGTDNRSEQSDKFFKQFAAPESDGGQT